MQKINKQKTFNFFKRKTKWLGIIDYKTLTFFIIYILIIIKIINIINISNILKLYIFIYMIVPFIIFILFNIKEESIIDKLFVILIFFIRRKNFIKLKNYAKLDKKYLKNVEK